MKSTRFYSVLAFSLLLTLWGCSNDDDGPSGPTVSNQIFATWQMSYFVENGDLVNEVPCDSDLKYTFNSNKNYSKTLYNTPESGSNCDISVVISGSWEVLEDNVLRLTPSSSAFNSETVTLKLISNNQQLEIKRSSTLTQVYNRM